MSYLEQQTIGRIKNLVDSLGTSRVDAAQDPGFLDLSDKDIRNYSFARAASQIVDVMAYGFAV